MILYIDTTDNDVAEIALILEKKKITERWQFLPHAEQFAEKIQKFLKKNKVDFAQISKIAVKVGPGFFSRVRTGVVAANALAYALGVKIIPVKQRLEIDKILKQKGQDTVKPFYGAEPNITKSKKKYA